VGENCHCLQELELSSCRGVTAACLIRLASSLTLLQDLLLADTQTVTDNVLTAIATHLPQLKTLNLFNSTGYTENAAHTLIHSLTCLRRFAIEPKHAVFTSLVLGLWMDRLPGLEVNVAHRCTPGCEKLYTWWLC
jgi:hypothetical protein